MAALLHATPAWAERPHQSDTRGNHGAGALGALQSKRPSGGRRQELEIHAVTTAEAAVWAAAKGLGVTRVLHYQCADAIKDGSLRIILANFEVEPLPVHLLHAGRGALPSKMRVFLDFAADRLRESLSSL